ncbi:uncharacterized protein LOC143600694 [Bidens hawaiensis]|uniref:uncharacterized protein LOC143600694 n=1 Tax=Bidens hawaiensis TaxID=980011 RepID=UPI00404A9D3A
MEEKMKLLEVLKLHKGEIAWRLSDIQGCEEEVFSNSRVGRIRDAAYSRSLNIKEKPKVLHDRRLKGGKLRSKWTGPYLVKEVFPYGVAELENPDNGTSWKVSGHCLMHYLGGLEDSIEVEENPLDPSL